jgi:hypothetical protein
MTAAKSEGGLYRKQGQLLTPKVMAKAFASGLAAIPLAGPAKNWQNAESLLVYGLGNGK